ncbi:hypothetical protein TNCV_3265911 [Trichonephila clavipes]|nr:hypothetical protein TNCV_3265911 [Trichonephila clavipes]
MGAVQCSGNDITDTLKHAHSYSKICRLRGVVGLSLAFCIEGCGFDPGPSRWIFMMQKIDIGHAVRLYGMKKIP